MLTGMFIFSVERTTRRQDAMSALYNKMKQGTWSWPSDIQISLNTFNFLNQTMQHDPLHRPTWQEMRDHSMFKDSQSNKIKLDIVFDTEPESGIMFEDKKIYVNTKDPTLYQRLHQKAIENYMNEHESDMEGHFDEILKSQDRYVKKIFPRISQELLGQGEPVKDELER